MAENKHNMTFIRRWKASSQGLVALFFIQI